MANPHLGDNASPVVVTGTRRCRSLTGRGLVAPPFDRPSGLRFVGRFLLALRHEFLALLAVDAFAVGFLGAFERSGGARLLGVGLVSRFGLHVFAVGLGGRGGGRLCRRRRRRCRRRCLRGSRADHQQGSEGGSGQAKRNCHGETSGLMTGAPSRDFAEPLMNKSRGVITLFWPFDCAVSCDTPWLR